MPNLNGPWLSFWLTWGTVALVLVGLYFAVLYWIENYMNAHRSEQAAREADARLEAERRSRALKIVNELKPLSARPARRLSMHQERHPK